MKGIIKIDFTFQTEISEENFMAVVDIVNSYGVKEFVEDNILPAEKLDAIEVAHLYLQQRLVDNLEGYADQFNDDMYEYIIDDLKADYPPRISLL
tara:strand:+ start:191 stop:475 length:285 start_codon:yes stop_codon:yes gene_type:complete